MFNHIVVCLDGSTLAEAILPYVDSFTRDPRTVVTLLHVGLSTNGRPGNWRGPSSGDRPAPTAAEVSEYLHRIAAAFEWRATVQHIVASEGLGTAITDFAEREHVDLIGLATHGRSGVARWIYGSVAERVVQTARVPVLLIRPGAEHVPDQELKHVIAPLDGSSLAESALPVVEAVATALLAPITLLRAVLVPTYDVSNPLVGPLVSYRARFACFEAEAVTYLNRVRSDIERKGLAVCTAAPVGFPDSEIRACAEAHPGSLVVMATHGRTGLRRTLLGSVAHQVLRMGIPTIVVPPAAAPAVVGD